MEVGSADAAVTSARISGVRRDLVMPQIAVAFFIALKLAYAVFVPPNQDEAYYWLWGAHLQWSYFDHSPLVGWASAAASLIFGWTPLGLHAPALATFLVLAYGLWRSSAWMAPEDPQRFFWVGLALFSASPLMGILTTLNYPDHLLICFSALSMLQFAKYLGDLDEGKEGNLVDLYLAAAFLGLAGLSKYNAVFIAAALLPVLLSRRRLRRLFRSPHLYLAGLVTLALTLPVLWWTATHRFQSVEFHALYRFEGKPSHIDVLGLLRVLATCVVALSPFIIPGFVRFLFGKPLAGRPGAFQHLGRATVLISAVAFLPLAMWSASSSQVSPHWLVLSFLPFLLVAPLFVRSKWAIGLHIGWGALLLGGGMIYYLLTPIVTEPIGLRDGEAHRTYGQEQLAAAATAAAKQHGIELIGAVNYGGAAKLAFALGTDRNIVDLGDRISELQLWRAGLPDAGSDMIVVAGGGMPVSRFKKHFESIEELQVVDVRRFGYGIAAYKLLLGRGFMR